MNEFESLTPAKNLKDLRQKIEDIERITSLWSGLTGRAFDDEIKRARPRILVPEEEFKFIALRAKDCTSYDELVHIIETQATDQRTGMMRGLKQPTLGALAENEEAP